jgi:hypothetical protein
LFGLYSVKLKTTVGLARPNASTLVRYPLIFDPEDAVAILLRNNYFIYRLYGVISQNVTTFIKTAVENLESYSSRL